MVEGLDLREYLNIDGYGQASQTHPLTVSVTHLDQEAVTTGEIGLHQRCQDGGLVFTGRNRSINHPSFDMTVLAVELHGA